MRAECKAEKRGAGGSGEEPKPKRGRTVEICKFWLKGTCKFGDKCHSNHPELPNQQPQAAHVMQPGMPAGMAPPPGMPPATSAIPAYGWPTAQAAVFGEEQAAPERSAPMAPRGYEWKSVLLPTIVIGMAMLSMSPGVCAARLDNIAGLGSAPMRSFGAMRGAHVSVGPAVDEVAVEGAGDDHHAAVVSGHLGERQPHAQERGDTWPRVRATGEGGG